jgi:hypothetical protein
MLRNHDTACLIQGLVATSLTWRMAKWLAWTIEQGQPRTLVASCASNTVHVSLFRYIKPHVVPEHACFLN